MIPFLSSTTLELWAELLHGNLKPSNIFIDGDKVYLNDALFSWELTHALKPRKPSIELINNLAYSYPKQVGSNLTVKDDIYAFSRVVYEVFANDLPNKGEEQDLKTVCTNVSESFRWWKQDRL